MTPDAQYRLIDSYIRDRTLRDDLAPSSVQVVRPMLRQWMRHVAPRPPRQWTEEDVATWVNDSAYRANYRKSRLTKLRPFIHWLILEGRLDRDPTMRMARIRIPDPDPRDLTEEEVIRLIAACPDQRAILIVILMMQLGLRAGDLARIRVEDIDTRRRNLHVRAKGGRGEYTHWEPIPTEAWEVLASWRRSNRHPSGPLIRSYQRPERGLAPASVGKLIGEWMQAAGIKEFPYDGRSSHALRHTCAQHMLDRGASIYQVQGTLGHKDDRTTRGYLRREAPGLREAMEGREYLQAA